MNKIYFDLESTGLNIYKDRIVQVGVVIQGDNYYKERQVKINPGVNISQKTSDIHGITNEMVIDCPKFIEVAPKIQRIFNGGDVIIGYNSKRFDINLLNVEMIRAGYEIDEKAHIDVFELWNRLDPPQSRGGRKLKDCYRHFTGNELEGAHDALVDIIGTKICLEKMMERYNFNLEDCINF